MLFEDYLYTFLFRAVFFFFLLVLLFCFIWACLCGGRVEINYSFIYKQHNIRVSKMSNIPDNLALFNPEINLEPSFFFPFFLFLEGYSSFSLHSLYIMLTYDRISFFLRVFKSSCFLFFLYQHKDKFRIVYLFSFSYAVLVGCIRFFPFSVDVFVIFCFLFVLFILSYMFFLWSPLWLHKMSIDSLSSIFCWCFRKFLFSFSFIMYDPTSFLVTFIMVA